MDDVVADDVGEVVELDDRGGDVGAEVSDASFEPSSLDDEAMYVFREGEPPMSGADIKKGYLQHKDYTQKTQALAQDRRALEQWQQQQAHELQQWQQQYQQQLQQQYQQYYQQQQAQGQQPQGPSGLDAIWQAAEANGGLITTAEAKQLVEYVEQQAGQPHALVVEAIRALNHKLEGVSQPINEMLTQRESQKLDSMIGNFMASKNIPQEFHESARDIFLDFYNANEPTPAEQAMGKTMESMFEDFASGRLEAMMGMSDAILKSQAANAQASLGRQGGATAPSKPLKPPMTSQEITDMFWKD